MSSITTVFALAIHLYCVSLSAGWLFSDNCYRSPINVGCFPITDPYTNAMGYGPQSPRDLDMHFIHKGPTRDVRFSLRQTRQRMLVRFDPSLKTVVIIHGFMERPTMFWIETMVEELRRTDEELNIFVVEWMNGASNINYFKCVANARMAGAITALFVQELVGMGASPDSFHLIGFSLGAHVAGYVGKRVRGLGRITGLDPAGPGFHRTHRDVRLDDTDAILVDVIHTDGHFGSLSPSGTIDFYPNGGRHQPSCASSTMDRISSFLSSFELSSRSAIVTLGCSHTRAPLLFASTINPTCFYSMIGSRSRHDMRHNRGTVCRGSDCPTFGYHLTASNGRRSNIYRFDTTGSYPFC